MTSRLGPQFKCATCHKLLGELGAHQIPGEVVFDSISGMTYSTTVNYCDKCIKDITGESLSKEVNADREKSETSPNISDKEIGRITKNSDTEIVIRIDDFGGKMGLTIREFVKSERYTGFTRSGTRIPPDKVNEFKQIIEKIEDNDFS